MTFIGKLLTVLNLVIAVGMAIWMTMVFTQRPSWFDTPDSSYEQSGALTFKQMTGEIDSLGKLAAATSRNWGVAVKNLEAREKLHKSRQPGYTQRLEWARNGNAPPGAKGKGPINKPGFFDEARIPNTATPELARGLTDLDDRSILDKSGGYRTLKGPDGRDLQGADTLLVDYHNTVVQITGDPANAMRPGLIAEIQALRQEQEMLQQEIVLTEIKLLKQLKIREEVQLEVLFLRDFQITTGGQRDTVYERKKQLEDRLKQVLQPAKN